MDLFDEPGNFDKLIRRLAAFESPAALRDYVKKPKDGKAKGPTDITGETIKVLAEHWEYCEKRNIGV